MTGIIYLLISVYFVFGALATHLVYKNREYPKRYQAWTKYWVYLIIIYGITTILILAPQWFPLVAMLITVIGLYELIRGGSRLPFRGTNIYILVISILIFGALSSGFVLFSFMSNTDLLFAFFVVASFDAFSQLMGQLLGKRFIFSKISPSKTLEGLVLGLLLSIATGGLAHFVADFSFWQAILIAAAISVFSLIGDLAASAFKRWCGIKDFSSLIPGHGGVLDRFDSLLVGGSAMYLISWLFL